MKFAFIVFKYFPFGGMQRDMLRTASHVASQGHQVDIYTLSWEGDIPAGLHVHVLPVQAWFNFQRYQRFIDMVHARLQQQGDVDCVVGYNRMPGLDVHFAADPCFVERSRLQRSWLYRFTPRYRWFAAAERAVFDRSSQCEILMVAKTEMPLFEKWYGTQPERMHYIPPYLSAERLALKDRTEMRQHLCHAFQLNPQHRIALLVGSGFHMKGLDRAIIALAALPEAQRLKTRLVAIGQDKPGPFVRMAQKLGVAEQLVIAKGRADIPWLMQGADLYVHPAYRENTGLVILEALAAGLPALVTETCGYAHHVLDADAGMVAAAPFDQQAFNTLFAQMLVAPDSQRWRENGIAYASKLMQANDGRAEAHILLALAQQKRQQVA
ncbi:MAG TPA: glycosyltransferase family 4 protein [Methylovorus sp.]|nr:glycosyltransferase family 4 protein [Methylovorus sp.]